MKTVRLSDNVSVFKVDTYNPFFNHPLSDWIFSKNYKHLYYYKNGTYLNYIEIIKGFVPNFYRYRFKNKDPYDVRKQNIEYYSIKPNIKGCKILESYEGHLVGFRIINSYWKMKDKLTDKLTDSKYYIMYIKSDIYFKFSEESLQIIKNRSWFITSGGYIATSIGNKVIYLRKLIMAVYKECYFGPDKLDHRITSLKFYSGKSNLIIKEQSNKNHNTSYNFDKIIISKCAITTWICYVPARGYHGEYFDINIQKNPIDKLRKNTSKSKKISLGMKFIEALRIRAKKIKELPELLDNMIDGKQFYNFSNFNKYNRTKIIECCEKYKIKDIKSLISLDNVILEKSGTNKQRHLLSFPEKSKYKPADLPKYTYYQKATKCRGSSIKYKKKANDGHINLSTTSKISISLDQKIEDMCKMIRQLGKSFKLKKKTIV